MTENIVWHDASASRDDRWGQLGMTGAVVWLTGLSGSGKSTVAVEVERLLLADRQHTLLLDGDNLRHGLNSDLGFSDDDRRENIRRVGEVSALLAEAGSVALVPLISPFRASRDAVRAVVERSHLRFVEVFIDTPLEICEQRDPKGLYAKARAGDIVGFTGIDSPYEAPFAAELVLTPQDGDPAGQAATIVAYLRSIA